MHQAITWTNVDLSSMEFYCIHLTTIPQEVLNISIHKLGLNATILKLLPHFAWGNELSAILWLTLDKWIKGFSPFYVDNINYIEALNR